MPITLMPGFGDRRRKTSHKVPKPPIAATAQNARASSTCDGIEKNVAF
jgi:hypothetical protein